MLKPLSSLLSSALDRVRPPAAEATVQPPAAATTPGDGFEASAARSGGARGFRTDTAWHGGLPLSEGRNFHATNTKEQMQEALASDANWFEGDVRLEIDGSGIEMRHDTQHESGDNLTLDEWLEIGKESGRGLKLDIKEPDQMAGVLDAIEAHGIPEDRLMLNLGFGGMEQWGPEIRARFPDATLALNPPTDGELSAADAQQMVDQAEALGGPVTFVVRHNHLSDEALEVFAEHPGSVSVWGSGVDDVAGRTHVLREKGVDGMIDLSSDSPGVMDTIDAGYNWVKTGIDKLF